jgi:4-diphosphocytidyl-2-C-methyl-D-erythritol kinase
MLNDLFALQLPDSQLKILAARLGSDCPFFIDPMPSLATGRGELLEPMHPGLSGFFAVIVKPPVSASTAHAYAMIQPMLPELPVRELIRLPVNEWQGRLGNDFEGPISHKIPEIAQLKQKLLEAGAVYASMTGSGSAVYGLFDREPVLGKALVECLVWKGFLK